jgi:ATP/maltotriose-dependent transcriptional regulator MalT
MSNIAPQPVAGSGGMLYGREQELALLRDCAAEALAGRGRVVLIAGDAGIGKTALVDTLAGWLRAQGALVLDGQCYDLLSTPPYGVWLDLLRSYQRLATPDLPDLPLRLAPEDSFAGLASEDGLLAELTRFLNALAEERPLLLLLDDQHWADADSLALLQRFVPLMHPRTLLVLTYRDRELPPDAPLASALPHIVRAFGPLRLTLGRLTQAAVERLLAERYALFVDDRQRLVDYLLRYAEGNPFFIHELLHALTDDGPLQHTPHGWLLGDLEQPQVPSIVRQMTHARISRLPDQAQRLLHVAAVIGGEVPLWLWEETSAASSDELSETIAAASAAQLLVESHSGTGYRFSHALVREALYLNLHLPRRRELHRRIADALVARRGSAPGVIAHHLEQAGDERSGRWLKLAGDHAARSNAPRDALALYQRALRPLRDAPQSQADQALLLCHMADVQRYTNAREALTLCREARELAESIGDRALSTIALWGWARVRGFLGEQTQRDLLDATAAWSALSSEERQRVLLLGQGFASHIGPFAQWLAHHGRYAEAIEIATHALVTSGADPDIRYRNDSGHAWFALGLAHAATGHPDAANDAFEQAVRHFTGAGHPFMAAAALKWQIVDVTLPYQASQPALWQQRMDAYAQAWGQTQSFAVSSSAHTLLPVFQPLLLSGQWDLAVESAQSYRGVSFLRVDALAALAEVALRRGESDVAWTCINEALPYGPASAADIASPHLARILVLHRLAAELALQGGQPDEARAWLTSHDELLEWSGRLLDRCPSLLLHAELAEHERQPEQARDILEQAVALARSPQQPLALLVIHRAQGRLALRLGDLDAATTHMNRAQALTDACAAPYEQALVMLARADLCLAQERPDDAATLVTDARRVLLDLGARPALARLEQLATRIPTRESVQVAVTLSPRELQVLRYVARGMTDAEVGTTLFISRRTVAHHLQSIYSKLGISSRTAAAAYAFEHGLLHDSGE